MLRRIILTLVLIVFLNSIFISYAMSNEKIKISRVEVQGNRNISKEEIIKVLELPEEVDEDTIRAGLQRVLDMGYFSNIDAGIRLEQDKYILVISVREAPIFKGVRITGNKEISTEEITNLISLKPGSTINLITLNQDLGKVAELYRGKGYVGANFQVNVTEDGWLIININEGPTVSGFKFKGNTVLASEVIEKSLEVYKGRTLSINLLRDMALSIQELYNKKGYPACIILNAYSEEGGIVTFEIGEGRISKIAVQGNQKTKDYVILREMETKVGEVLNRDKIQKDLQKIFNLGYFSDVNADIKSAETPGEIILTVKVVEQLTGQANGGLAYSTKDGISLILGIRDSNLFGTGRNLGLYLNIGLTAHDVTINYTEPYIFGTTGTLNSSLIWRQADTTDVIDNTNVNYLEDRKTLELVLDKPVSSELKASIGFSYNDINYQAKDEGTTLPDIMKSGISSAIVLGVAKDTRNVIFNPTKGNYYGISLKQGGGILGGDFNFTKISLDLRWYLPTSDKDTFAINYLWGLGFGELPYIEKFSVGGVNSVRGLPENWKKSDYVELLSLEYRNKMQDNIFGVIFLDFGNGWKNGETINPLDLYTGIGIGLRIMIPPMGLLRLDYGWGSYDWQGRFYFSIGQKF
ncbi:MAG: BamA/TamA family outer membrane protein [bacterium]|nr:BamA/TamA family outer membrane protein [bacterium]